MFMYCACPYPRHVCPLCVEVFMHLPNTSKSPPELAGLGINDHRSFIFMQPRVTAKNAQSSARWNTATTQKQIHFHSAGCQFFKGKSKLFQLILDRYLLPRIFTIAFYHCICRCHFRKSFGHGNAYSQSYRNSGK